MQLRKNKPQPEQGRARQSRSNGDRAVNPAFSYYNTNRVAESRPRQQTAPAKTGKGRLRFPTFFSQLPFWVLMAVIVVCAVKVLALTTDPKVIVLGQNATTEKYLQPTSVYEVAARKVLASSITNRTKLTVNLDGTAARLEHQFPELETVSLTVPLAGNRPIVYVAVAQPSIILESGTTNYAVNRSGLVLAKVRTIPTGVPLVSDQSGSTVRTGTQYLPSSTMNFIRTVAYQLKSAHLAVTAYVLPAASPYELDIRLDGKPYVLRFNLQADVLQQSGAAIATITQLGSTTPVSYIDVRLPGQVYYK